MKTPFILLLLVIATCFSCQKQAPHRKEEAKKYLYDLAKLEQQVGLEVQACMKTFATKDSITIYDSIEKTKRRIDEVLPKIKQVPALAGEEALKIQAIKLIEGYADLCNSLLPEMAIIILRSQENGMTNEDQTNYLIKTELLKERLKVFQTKSIETRKDFVERYGLNE
ncbi:MAG: hypothetical protein ACPGJS_14585 [Flammeovirgaceae bacterium]